MYIARFTAADKGPAYGIIELEVDDGEHPETVAVITGGLLTEVPVNYMGARYDLMDVRLFTPVILRSKIVVIGRNYVGYTAGQRVPIPGEPVLFIKSNTCVIEPNEPIIRPERCKDLHRESELAIVIRWTYKQIPARRVAEVVFGYTIANNVIARGWQREDDQWFRIRGCDTLCPLGLWIDTHLTLAEVGHLATETRVGEEVRRQGSISQLVRGIPELVTYISSFATLLPGEVTLTGTPVGAGPMADEDVVSVEVDGLGMLSGPVTAAQSSTRPSRDSDTRLSCGARIL